MYKKVLSLLMVFTLILPAFGTVNASDVSEDVENKAAILRGLDIMPENSIIDSFNTVSKSAFINYIFNMMGDYGYSEAYNENAVLHAEKAGIIKDRADGVSAPLMYENALTMLVRALGYEEFAIAKGGYPYGYVQVAASLGISDGTQPTSDGLLKKYQAVQLLYNTLDINIAAISAIKSDGEYETVTYDTTTNETMLYAYRKIYKVEGVLETSGISGLRNAYSAEAGQVSIAGEVYMGTGYDALLGHRVAAYIKELDGKDEVVYMHDDDSKVLSLDTEDVINMSSDFKTLSYYDYREKKDEARLTSTISVIYNGLTYPDYTTDMFKPADGVVKLIDNDGDNVYDVASITSYKTVVADVISRSEQTVKNIYTFDSESILVDLEADDSNYIDIVKDGKRMEFNDLSRFDVLRIAEASSGGIRKVYVEASSDVETGAIASVTNTAKGQMIEVNGRELYVSDTLATAIEKKDPNALTFDVGDRYSFYLDSNARVVYVDLADGNDGLLYALVTETATDGTLDTEHKVRFFTSEGEWEIRTFRDKVECNGQNGMKPTEVFEKISTLQAQNIMVVMGYELNSEGKITKVELPLEPNADYDKERINMKTGLDVGYKLPTNSFMSQVFVEASPIIWGVDKRDMSNDLSYTVESVSTLSHNSLYTYSAYNLDEFNFADIFVIEVDENTVAKKIENADLFIVTNVGKGINSEGTVSTMVKGVMGTDLNSTWFSDVPEVINGLKEGDIISVYADSTGNVTNKVVYYSAGSNMSYGITPSLYATSAILTGEVSGNSISGKRIKISDGTKDYVYRTEGRISVLIYDSEAKVNKVQPGTIEDIIEGDIVIAKTAEAVMRSIVVIR